jgi:SAM-dependent methyltransferase
MLTSLLPYHTYRRMVAVMVARSLSGRGRLRSRLANENWRTYRRFRDAAFTCNVCGGRGRPYFDFPDLERRREHSIGVLRETLQCVHCGATMRHRTLVAGLLRVLRERTGRPLASARDIDAAALAGLEILDADAFSPLSRLLRGLPGYRVSSYRPDLPPGAEIGPGCFNVDLQRIAFPPASFDIVLTSDVMEHVRDLDAAHREIARVLKDGGRYVFTVPYDDAMARHRVLVDTSGPEDVFLVPPQYHGDPLSGGVLAYRVFGREIVEDLAQVGLRAEFVALDDPSALIVGGDLFVAAKALSLPVDRLATASLDQE